MSSENVWTNLIKCIKAVTTKLEPTDHIKGIGFISVAGLVCLDEKGQPVTASTSNDPNINIILHYDPRSKLEARTIYKTHHERLRYRGERLQPDMHESMLMWLKNNLKENCWDKVGHFMDVTDFLTWKATGSLVRSSCCLSAKWSYVTSLSGVPSWDAQFFKEIGIPEVAENDFRKIGSEVQTPGKPLADGLLEAVAKEMKLPPKLPVATGMTEPYAGCLGLIGCQIPDNIAEDFTSRTCIIVGLTSASHFIFSREPRFVKGTRGPFRDSVLPNMWLNHAEQTTAESILQFIIDSHPATTVIKKQIAEMHIHKYLNKILKSMAQKSKQKDRAFLSKHLHISPDYDGNRCPLGDPRIRGMFSGLTFSRSQESLALIYLAAMQSVAYSSRHISSNFTQFGHDARCILIGGNLGKNSVFAQLHKDICQLPIVIPEEPRCMLLGAAILAGVASNYFHNFKHAMQEMCGLGKLVLPDKDTEVVKYHDKKYEVFLKMYDHQMEYRRIMGDDVEG
ncbi:unnamed protein product [Ceutorhynchus assimilis]|uniref:Carbohydrate kinase FGGY C-terminal domain-containing protein n=1 Tax=Ceutorhynchus assimilis TaxID=467358 RepID=A0A9P0DDC0_9CUCU|nr:unnamed protein product [Ceutorhynchus assimilis]